MRDAAIGEAVAKDGDSSVCTEEDVVCNGANDFGLELRDMEEEEEEGEGEEEEGSNQCHPLTLIGDEEGDEDIEEVSYRDTEKLVSRDSPPRGGGTRTMYSSSSKCCKTKASIIISKTTFLLVGVAVLVVGAVVAGTIQHHPTEGQCSNSSLVDQSSDLFPTPTRTNDQESATPLLVITPSPTRSHRTKEWRVADTLVFISPSPSSSPSGWPRI